VLYDRRDGHSLNRGGILVERFDLDFKAWVGRGEHPVTTALVVLDPLLPASGGDPQTVDQHDGVRSGRGGRVLGSHSVLLESTSPRVRLSTQQVSRRIFPMARLPEFSEPNFGPR
jgi:hypothetical protein